LALAALALAALALVVFGAFDSYPVVALVTFTLETLLSVTGSANFLKERQSTCFASNYRRKSLLCLLDAD